MRVPAKEAQVRGHHVVNFKSHSYGLWHHVVMW